MTITLYVFPPSPRAFKPILLANHLGIEHTLHALAPGETKSPDFARLNLNQRQPVMTDGDYALWESNAILEYLAAQKPEAGLMPKEMKAQLQVRKWLYWDLAHWDQAAAIFMFERFVKAAFNMGTTNESEIARGTELMTRLADVLETQLTQNRFIAGDHLTLADFAIVAPLPYRDIVSFPIADRPSIARWIAELEALPAWQKSRALPAMPKAA